jgi:hypothetical protein
MTNNAVPARGVFADYYRARRIREAACCMARIDAEHGLLRAADGRQGDALTAIVKLADMRAAMRAAVAALRYQAYCSLSARKAALEALEGVL